MNSLFVDFEVLPANNNKVKSTLTSSQFSLHCQWMTDDDKHERLSIILLASYPHGLYLYFGSATHKFQFNKGEGEQGE